jgi:tetratricopeptide (TPR) repeat protein
MRLWSSTIAFTLAALLIQVAAAAVPGSQAASQVVEAPRILQLETLRGVSKSDRQSVYEEYVLAFRSATERGNQAQARELAERATTLFPDRRRPWCHLAAARLRIDQWGPAIEAARRAEKARDDDDPPPLAPDESAAGAAYWEGWALYRTQRYSEAMPRLRQARQRATRWAEAARALGEAEFVTGHTKEAAAAYGAAFELDPTIGTVHDLAYCAEARSVTGDLEGGVAALQEALRRAPFEPGLHAKLGDLLRREGSWTEAYYELVLEGLLQGRDGRYTTPAVTMAQAIIDTVRADAKNPHRHELLLVASGLSSLDAGEPHHAVHELRHLLRTTRSASPVPRLLLADALYRDDQNSPSQAVLDEILSTTPEFVPALYLMSDVQTKLGQPRQAASALERARELFPAYWKLKSKSGGS